jgi:hypothetical protein
MVTHHVPDHATHPPTRVRVVRDVGDALRRHLIGTDFENLVLHCVRNPTVNTVTDHVIEHAPRLIDVRDAGVPKVEILHAELADPLFAFLDLPIREIATDELAVR